MSVVAAILDVGYCATAHMMAYLMSISDAIFCAAILMPQICSY